MFDEHELQILIQGLDAWAAEKAQSNMLGDMMMAVLCPASEREAMKAQMEIDGADVKRISAERKEESTLIKAKLIQMKRELVAEGLFGKQREPNDSDGLQA